MTPAPGTTEVAERLLADLRELPEVVLLTTDVGAAAIKLAFVAPLLAARESCAKVAEQWIDEPGQLPEEADNLLIRTRGNHRRKVATDIAAAIRSKP